MFGRSPANSGDVKLDNGITRANGVEVTGTGAKFGVMFGRPPGDVRLDNGITLAQNLSRR